MTGEDRGDTLQRLLDRATRHPRCGIRLLDRHEEDTWLRWREIAERAEQCACGLRALGVRPGDRVGLVYRTGADFFDALFGILGAGAVPAPMYAPVRIGRLDEYTSDTARMLQWIDARLVLVDPRVRRLFGGVASRFRPSLGVRTLAELPHGVPSPAATGAPDDLALVQFSSGTTRRPRPVALTQRAVVTQTRVLNGFWPDGPDVRHSGVSWLPLNHDMGLIGCVFPALERPSTLTLLSPETFVARPATWLRAVSRYRATISPAPNFGFALAADRIRDDELRDVDLSSWRVAPNGAEPISVDVVRRFRERFRAFGLRDETLTPVYGLSEASLAVTFSDVERPFETRRFDVAALETEGRAVESADGREWVSVGRAVPGTEVRVRDAERRDLPDDRVGAIAVRGPSVMREYLGRPNATAEVLSADGWLTTGDLGFFHDGSLYVTGRSKDVVILRGRNHDPASFERAIAGIDGVRPGRAVAVGRVGPEGETLTLFVEIRRGTPFRTGDTLVRRCADAVLAATGILPGKVVLLPPGSLPRTSSGKLRRRETARRHERGTLAAPGKRARVRVAGEWVRSSISFAGERWRDRGKGD